MNNSKQKGAFGEQIATNFLKAQKYKILETNYHASRLAEIDVIALDGEYLVFVEVKLRSSLSFGGGLEAVNKRKQNYLRYAAKHYLTVNKKYDCKCRFDVLEIIYIGETPEFTLIKDAF